MFDYETTYDQEDQYPKMRAKFLTGVAFNLASQGNIPTTPAQTKKLFDCLVMYTDELFDRVQTILEETQ